MLVNRASADAFDFFGQLLEELARGAFRELDPVEPRFQLVHLVGEYG